MIWNSVTLFAALSATAHAGSFDKYLRSHSRHIHHHAHQRRAYAIEDILLPSISPAANETEELDLSKRSSGECAFPYGANMVAVTPDSSNAGWAMSPDQPCTPGSYCPFACSPGMVMDQWDPAATTYSYPESMYGGLYCDADGTMSKPYPSRDYCKSISDLSAESMVD